LNHPRMFDDGYRAHHCLDALMESFFV